MVISLAHRAGLGMAALLLTATILLAAQNAISTVPSDGDHASSRSVLLDTAANRPTAIDAFNNRPDVKSPDGTLGVTVTGPRKSYEAWVTISPSTFPDSPVQVWPLQASADVLWRPDSRAFALTDYRYANLSYVLVCGTEFRMGESGEGPGVPITDLTPIVRKAFGENARKYYQSDSYETRLFYARVLRWIGSDKLLVGISARTVGPSTLPNRGQMEWDFAYLVNVPGEKVTREVNKEQLLSEYKIAIPN